MAKPDYGTLEYYTEYFSDILADCAVGEPERDIETLRLILEAFDNAILEWLNYHQQSADIYKEARMRFLDTIPSLRKLV
jgi:succinate dehydrogenase flavin-adding protein (antitoxin of CptAB toxin-antitoxin module)